MGKKDVSSIEYFENPIRFADVINGFVLSGNQIIQPENIHIRKKSDSIITDDPKSNIITVNRDIVRNADIAMNTTIIALENQTAIHYAMPVRVMTGDAAIYHNQWRTLASQHYKKKDLKPDEYLSGIKKDEKLFPVSTIIVYFGQDPWEAPRSLKEMLATDELPPEMQNFIADYPLHILDIRRYNKYDQFQTDLRAVCGFLRNDQNADELNRYISEHKEDFSNMAIDTVCLISEYSHSKQLLEHINQETYQTKEEGMNMCKAIDDLMERNLNKGVEIGIERSIEKIIHKLNKLNSAREYIVDFITDSFSLTPEQADFYMKKYQ